MQMNLEQVTDDKVNNKIYQELLEKLERLKALTSHENKNLKELLHDIVDEALLRKDPECKAEIKKIEN